MQPALLSLACLALLALSAHLDPVGAPARIGTAAAATMAFTLGRPLLPGGAFHRMILLGAGFCGAAAYALGLSATHVGALALYGVLLGIFLTLLDLLTLRRSTIRRLYNFAVVLGVIGAAWYGVAIWITGLQFPSPELVPALLGELASGAALACACMLAAPGLGDSGVQVLPSGKSVLPSQDLQAELGPGGALLPASLRRDTIRAPSEQPSEPASEESSEESDDG